MGETAWGAACGRGRCRVLYPCCAKADNCETASGRYGIAPKRRKNRKKKEKGKNLGFDRAVGGRAFPPFALRIAALAAQPRALCTRRILSFAFFLRSLRLFAAIMPSSQRRAKNCPFSTVTACPCRTVRSPWTDNRNSPPRSEHWNAWRLFFPSFFAQ